MAKFKLKADATFSAIDYFEACEKIAHFFEAKSNGRYIGKESFYKGRIALTYAHLAEETEDEENEH